MTVAYVRVRSITGAEYMAWWCSECRREFSAEPASHSKLECLLTAGTSTLAAEPPKPRRKTSRRGVRVLRKKTR
jgi:hypothetical protein